MTIEDFCNSLSQALASASQEEIPATVADRVSTYFGVQPHEVGLFVIDHRRHQINFRWPLIMSQANRIPLKAIDSLVAKTANFGESFYDNSFASSRHLFMFEHMLVDKAERIRVQKVMSVPIVDEKGVAGVVQVVRKGASAEEAGDDFTSATVGDLEKIAAVLSTRRL